MKRRMKKTIKNTFMLFSVAIALIAGSASFIGATNRMSLDGYFFVQMVVFVLSMEYVFMFLYANGALDDDDHIVFGRGDKYDDDFE